MSDTTTTIVEEMPNPEEIARFRERRGRHRRNEHVYQDAVRRDLDAYRGKVVVVAGQELYAADTAEAAWRWARARHPEDGAPLVQYVPREKGWLIYAALR